MSAPDLATFSPVAVRSYVLCVAAGFSYDDFTSGVGKSFAKLPVGSIVTGGGIAITTVWNSGTSDSLEVGDSADPNEYHSAEDITSAFVGAFDATPGIPVTTSTQSLLIEITSAGAAATAGVGQIYVTYVDPSKADENFE